MSIKLEIIREKDLEQVVRWINAEQKDYFLQWGGNGGSFSYPLDNQQMTKHYIATLDDPPIRRLFKAIQNDVMVGYLELNNINLEHLNAAISRVIVCRTYEGKGIGREMVKQLTHIAFNEFGLYRISLGVFDFNTPAIRCYEKVGFKREGLLRESMKVNDTTYWNSILMSVLRTEWFEDQN
jgi:RimJ/RimL family protein N-acetyltransferase